MRDYAELVGVLRICNIEHECAECPRNNTRKCMTIHSEASDAIEELLAEVKHWELEAAANETDRNYLIDENRKLVNSLMNFRVPTWISVEERLPEINDDVLVCNMDYGKTELGFATDAVWDGDNFLSAWNRASAIHCVTHWMPLPEPPKEVE